jgi:hypothetical protein
MVTAPLGPARVGIDASLGLDVLQLDFQWTVKPAASVSVLALWGF